MVEAIAPAWDATLEAASIAASEAEVGHPANTLPATPVAAAEDGAPRTTAGLEAGLWGAGRVGGGGAVTKRPAS
jgi:hypothetical protein